jgi:hypothetical protein
MNKKIIGIVLITVMLFTLPAVAQVSGDLNCNGWIDVADLVFIVNILGFPCDTNLSECWRRNGDADDDGWPLTIADMHIIPYFLIGGYGNFPPSYPQNPQYDTIMIESVTVSPGETISLPVWINTVDTLVAIQFWIELDTNYVEFDSMVVYDELPLRQFNCDGNLYSNTLFQGYDNSIVFLPGNYHIADIIINIKLENDRPVTTYLSFSSAPQRALYSGFANYFFFQPIMVDAEITIIP